LCSTHATGFAWIRPPDVVLPFAQTDNAGVVARRGYDAKVGVVSRFLLPWPDWRVDSADARSDSDGKASFASAVAASFGSEPAAQNVEIRWRAGALSSSMGESASDSTTMPIFGTIAHMFQNVGAPAARWTTVALWEIDGCIFEFRARVDDLNAFSILFASLRRVDEIEWLAALPATAVKPSDHAATVAAMLHGVSAPPGFDPTTIQPVGLVKDRYQFGALVAGTVACTWFKHWSEARRDDNAEAVREAIEALSTAKDWPILREMAESGAYPWVIEQLVQAMPAGGRHGRPLEDDVNSSLGCPALGVPLSHDALAP
jgi:hypothetical protein